MGSTHILNSAAQPTNAPSPHMWHHARGNKQAFEWHKTHRQEAALLQQRNNQPNTNFLTFCAQFMPKCQLIQCQNTDCTTVYYSLIILLLQLAITAPFMDKKTQIKSTQCRQLPPNTPNSKLTDYYALVKCVLHLGVLN